MSRPPSSQTTPQLHRISDKDLSEIELHSVDSINDLHRTQHEHSHKGTHMHAHTHTHMNQPLKHKHTRTLMDSAVYNKYRDAASTSCLHTCPEWDSLHVWHAGWSSKRPSSWQQMAEPSTGYVDAQLIACLCHGLRHRHSAPPDSFTHLLLLGWDDFLVLLFTLYSFMSIVWYNWILKKTKTTTKKKPSINRTGTCVDPCTACLHSVSPPVQQGGAVQRLTEVLKEKEVAATELSLLIQELQALRHNLTAMRGATWGKYAQRNNKLTHRLNFIIGNEMV